MIACLLHKDNYPEGGWHENRKKRVVRPYNMIKEKSAILNFVDGYDRYVREQGNYKLLAEGL